MNQKKAIKYLSWYKEKTNPLFIKYLSRKIAEASTIGSIPKEVTDRLLKLVLRGKKVRGALMVLGYKAAGGRNEAAILEASLFIEMFHAGLLIHDDIMDQDELRRGLPSMHKQFKGLAKKYNVKTPADKYGESLAINVGDIAFFIAMEKLFESDFVPERITNSARIFSRYAIRVGLGQALDVTNSPIQLSKESEITNIYKLKTAEYTGALPLLIGATLADCSDRTTIESLREYGLCLGWAFQLRDDLLGLFGDAQQLGKPIGGDIREGKRTLLLLQLMKRGSSKDKKILLKVFGNNNITKTELEKLQVSLRDSGSYQYIVELGEKYIMKGKKQIQNITNNRDIQTIFTGLLELTMARKS